MSSLSHHNREPYANKSTNAFVIDITRTSGGFTRENIGEENKYTGTFSVAMKPRGCRVLKNVNVLKNQFSIIADGQKVKTNNRFLLSCEPTC